MQYLDQSENLLKIQGVLEQVKGELASLGRLDGTVRRLIDLYHALIVRVDIHAGVQYLVSAQSSNHAQKLDADRKVIRDWLDATDTNEEYYRNLNKKTAGTCIWLSEQESYKEWLNWTARTLLVIGKPGTYIPICSSRFPRRN